MALEYGNGGAITVTMDGPFGETGFAGVKLGTINAVFDNWKGAESPYSQTVAVEGISVSSKVDVQLSTEQMALFKNKIIAFQAVNNSGVITLLAYGGKPEADCALQVTITEVTGEGVVYGDIVITTTPQADYGQTDESKADFIRNKPDGAIQKAQQTADSAKATAEAALPRAGGIMDGTIDMNGQKLFNLPLPETDADAVNRSYLETYVKSKRRVFTLLLTAEGWTGEKPFVQTAAVEGVLGTDMPHYSAVYDADQETRLAQKEAFAMVDDLDTEDGSVTFTCFEDKPEVDIPIQMEVMR